MWFSFGNDIVPQHPSYTIPCTNPSARSFNRVLFSIVFSGIAVLVLFYIKPKDMFEINGKPKSFGFKQDETLLSVGVITFLISAITLFIYTWIDMVFLP